MKRGHGLHKNLFIYECSFYTLMWRQESEGNYFFYHGKSHFHELKKSSAGCLVGHVSLDRTKRRYKWFSDLHTRPLTAVSLCRPNVNMSKLWNVWVQSVQCAHPRAHDTICTYMCLLRDLQGSRFLLSAPLSVLIRAEFGFNPNVSKRLQRQNQAPIKASLMNYCSGWPTEGLCRRRSRETRLSSSMHWLATAHNNNKEYHRKTKLFGY